MEGCRCNPTSPRNNYARMLDSLSFTFLGCYVYVHPYCTSWVAHYSLPSAYVRPWACCAHRLAQIRCIILRVRTCMFAKKGLEVMGLGLSSTHKIVIYCRITS
ncbi:hypothetical protein BDV36DRAFT_277902 [Aspergillus pseudocaelatus]|uniref:Uncharacterized protein n=1 Tax=Aspergillus pseudocaelatus TaxID=1825620 RepID=A0ABQ6VZT5_9EURO|nr:hypothetical protein BDV36DRAFT_277902 [Aspergillus pseudocaelatus]